MGLISSPDLLEFTDKLAAAWDRLLVAAGSVSDALPAAGTVRGLMAELLSIPVASTDAQQEMDLVGPCNDVLTKAGIESAVAFLQPVLSALNKHCQLRGPALNPSVNSLSAYLNFLNATPFTALAAPGFSDLYLAVMGSALPAQTVFSRGVSPDLNAAAYPDGMGHRAVGAAFTAGYAVDNTKRAEVVPVLVVTADFAGGTAPPSVTAAGVDHTGSGATTWTAVLDANNPASALATTITPPVVGRARQAVALGSAAGVMPGSVLAVNAGLADQETVVAEAVGGGVLTAYFALDHAAGATLAGRRSYVLVPSVAGRRMRSCTGLTITATGHTAGTVRAEGAQDRVPF